MSHHVYHTKGIVLKNRPRGEANAELALFTRNLGLIFAAAQGLRHLKSKLRANVQEYSVGTFDVVKGKALWRLTNAEESYNFYSKVKAQSEAFKMSARVLALVSRLVKGEEPHPELFEAVLEILEFIRSQKWDAGEIKALEYLAVWRILVHLGYGREVPELAPFSYGALSSELLAKMNEVAPIARAEINRTLKETQL